MGTLRGSVGKKSQVIALALAVGLSLAAQGALADRPRHNTSAPRHSSSPPQQHRQHHVQPNPFHHFSRPPARIVVAPVYVPRRYYYVPPPVYVAPVIAAVPMVLPSMNSGYWYFCPDSQAYYPYVLECPSGWLQVVPQ